MNGKQLKNSILQWAIQGKLVPQDPNDEPASVLLERIRKEKTRLQKEGKIKKDKNESVIFRGEDNSYYEKPLATGQVRCIDNEIPFEIPQGWEWVRLSQICTMQAGKNISASKIYSEESSKYPYRCVGGNGLRGYTYGYNVEGHFSIIGRQGALCGCMNMENGKFYATEHAVIVDTYSLIDSEFIFYFFTALNLNQYSTATAQPGLAVSTIAKTFCPLPPLTEQARIVTILRSVDLLIKRYGQAQDSLDMLNANINEQLRKSILQEAIQGRLVPQLPEEGTAEDLLSEIRKEKERLVKEGKLKKSALEDSRIYKGEDNKYYEQVGSQCVDITEEIPFDLPCQWQWCRFGLIASLTIGKTPARGEQKYWSNGQYNWISISDMSERSLIQSTKEKISQAAVDQLFTHSISPKNSLIMSFKLTVGRTSVLGIDAYHNEAIITVQPYIDINYALRNFLLYVLPIIANNGESKDAIKGKTLNSKSLANLLIPLPTILEQQRIVAQIERLFEQLK